MLRVLKTRIELIWGWMETKFGYKEVLQVKSFRSPGLVYFCILPSDLAKHAIPKMAGVAYSVGVDELGWQYGTRLKSHGTNWCTRRGWPVNCMTVISARWWSKHAIPKTAEVAYSIGHLWEEIEWALNYYITQCTGNSISWGSDELEIRCGRENQHPERLGP